MPHAVPVLGRRRCATGALVLALLVTTAACGSSGTAGNSSRRTGSNARAGNNSGIPATLAAFFPGKKATGAPVKIGLINDEGSSPTALPSQADAAVAAAKYANDELGGLAGHVIQVDRCSENEDVASATACANKMVEDNVAAVVSLTGFGDTIVPIVTKAGIPYVAVTGAAPSEGTTTGSFMWTGGFASTLISFAKYAAKQGWKKVTAFDINVPAAILGAKMLGNPAFTAAGIGLTIQPVDAGIADATPEVTAGLNSKPDAVAVIADPATCTSILKALGIVDPTVPKMVIYSCLDNTTLAALGNALEGVKVFGVSSTTTDDPEAQLFQTVMAKYVAKGDVSAGSVTGYQSMLGLIRAVNAGGPTGVRTPAAISAAIKAAKNVPLPAGAGLLTFTCDGKQLQGQPSDCSSGQIVLTVKDSKGTDPQLVK